VYLGGILSNSTAVITDATHMGIDVASFVISLSAMYLATKKSTVKLSFGYVRAGLLFWTFVENFIISHISSQMYLEL
jgi:Co/Zn/Cd efflux system component